MSLGSATFRDEYHKEDIAYDYYLLFLETTRDGKYAGFIVLGCSPLYLCIVVIV